MHRINLAQNSLAPVMRLSEKCPHCGSVSLGKKEYCHVCFNRLKLTSRENARRIPVARFGNWIAGKKAVLAFLVFMIAVMTFVLSKVKLK